MENDEEVKEIVVGERQDSTLKALEEEYAQYLGFPDVSEKKVLANLNRLHQSLRGPEGLLDKGNYSRPFPPATIPNTKPQQLGSTASAAGAGAGRRQGD